VTHFRATHRVRPLADFPVNILKNKKYSTDRQADSVSALSASIAIFADKRRGKYRFSILLIDDNWRIGLEGFYRIPMHD
jgi:hypothetical protein